MALQERQSGFVRAGFDYDRTRGYLFRSDRDSLARSPGDALDPTLAEAVHASSNAPVLYFDAPARVPGCQFWNGGIAGYNNPLNALIQPVRSGTDWVVPPGLTPRDFAELIKLPMDAVEQDRVDLIVKPGQAWIDDFVLNQPVRTNRETLACEIGYRRFGDGVATWQQLPPRQTAG